MACADTARLVCIGNVVDAGEKTHVLHVFFSFLMQSSKLGNHNPHVKTSVTCRWKEEKKKKEATRGVLLCLVVLSSRLCNTEHTSVIGIPFLKHLNPPQWGDRRNTLQHFFSHPASQARIFFLVPLSRLHLQLWPIITELPASPARAVIVKKNLLLVTAVSLKNNRRSGYVTVSFSVLS